MNADKTIFNDEGPADGFDAGVLDLESVLGDEFEFVADLADAVRGGELVGANCRLDENSRAWLGRSAQQQVPSWRKTFLCGVIWPEGFSVASLAEAWGYDEFGPASQPENQAEAEYLDDPEAWYSKLVENELARDCRELFGRDLEGSAFLLRGIRPDGSGVGLVCRIVCFQ